MYYCSTLLQSPPPVSVCALPSACFDVARYKGNKVQHQALVPDSSKRPVKVSSSCEDNFDDRSRRLWPMSRQEARWGLRTVLLEQTMRCRRETGITAHYHEDWDTSSVTVHGSGQASTHTQDRSINGAETFCHTLCHGYRVCILVN